MKRRPILAACIIALVSTGRAVAADSFTPYDNHATAGMTRVESPFYFNRNYGYGVLIPEKQDAWMAAAPAPNHGFRIFLGARRSMEMDASYDTALLGSTSAVAKDAASSVQGASVQTTDDDLDGDLAERLTFSGPGDRRKVVVTLWRDRGPDDAVVYTASLETTAAYFDRDKHVFDNMLGGFRLLQWAGQSDASMVSPVRNAMDTMKDPEAHTTRSGSGAPPIPR